MYLVYWSGYRHDTCKIYSFALALWWCRMSSHNFLCSYITTICICWFIFLNKNENGTNFTSLHYTKSHIKVRTSWAVELQLSFALVCVSCDEWTMIYSWDGGCSDTWTTSCLGVWNRHLTKMSQESYQSCGLIMKWFLVTVRGSFDLLIKIMAGYILAC